MKLVVLVPLSVALSVAVLGVVKLRGKENAREEKRNRFHDIKLRVTLDVLGEYQREVEKIQTERDKTETEVKTLDEDIKKLQSTQDGDKTQVGACQGAKKHLSDELAAVESEVNNLNGESKQQKTSWETDVASLKQIITQRSKVCDFVKNPSARKLCGGVVNAEDPKQEDAKAEAPKQDGAKAEAPKQDGAEAEAPKQDSAKAEAPKQEDAKAGAPKQDGAKAEAPKQADAKAEAPKQEDAKAVAPKQEDAKAVAPKQEDAKAVAPKQEDAKAVAPKQEDAKAEALKRR